MPRLLNKAAALLALLFAISAHAAQKPNILFIMADDLGWMDLACQGNKLVDTPHLDRLAKQGMRFTSAYAAAPVCSPTRCAVLTGQAPARIGLTTHLPGMFFPKDNRPQPAKANGKCRLRTLVIPALEFVNKSPNLMVREIK